MQLSDQRAINRYNPLRCGSPNQQAACICLCEVNMATLQYEELVSEVLTQFELGNLSEGMCEEIFRDEKVLPHYWLNRLRNLSAMLDKDKNKKSSPKNLSKAMSKGVEIKVEVPKFAKPLEYDIDRKKLMHEIRMDLDADRLDPEVARGRLEELEIPSHLWADAYHRAVNRKALILKMVDWAVSETTFTGDIKKQEHADRLIQIGKKLAEVAQATGTSVATMTQALHNLSAAVDTGQLMPSIKNTKFEELLTDKIEVHDKAKPNNSEAKIVETKRRKFKFDD